MQEEYEVNENLRFTFLLVFTGFGPLVSRDSFTPVCLTALRHVYRGMSSSKLLRTLLTCSASKKDGKATKLLGACAAQRSFQERLRTQMPAGSMAGAGKG